MINKTGGVLAQMVFLINAFGRLLKLANGESCYSIFKTIIFDLLCIKGLLKWVAKPAQKNRGIVGRDGHDRIQMG